MGDYANHTTRSIKSLTELKPGDHIRVRGVEWGLITHHLLVIKVIDSTNVRVIHKQGDGVVEEELSFQPEDITVLDYKSPYSRHDAIQRAQEHLSEEYCLFTGNCEHFVTEALTGEKQSYQIQSAVFGGIMGAAVGAVAGAGLVAAAQIDKKDGDKKDGDKEDGDEEDGDSIGDIIIGGLIGAALGALGGAAVGTQQANTKN